MAKYANFKNELKVQASKIRSDRATLKEAQRSFKECWRLQSDLLNMQSRFRHEHIAYCLLRGRTYEQIENKVAPGNEPDMDRVKDIMDRQLIVCVPEASDAETVCSGS